MEEEKGYVIGTAFLLAHIDFVLFFSDKNFVFAVKLQLPTVFSEK